MIYSAKPSNSPSALAEWSWWWHLWEHQVAEHCMGLAAHSGSRQAAEVSPAGHKDHPQTWHGFVVRRKRICCHAGTHRVPREVWTNKAGVRRRRSYQGIVSNCHWPGWMARCSMWKWSEESLLFCVCRDSWELAGCRDNLSVTLKDEIVAGVIVSDTLV